MTDKLTIDVELICVDLPTKIPPGLSRLHLGLQVGQEVEQETPCPAKQIEFRFPVKVEIDTGNDTLRFSGKAVHGPSGGKFLYLCWGERVDGKWHGVRRAKLPMEPVTRKMVEAALQAQQPLRARIHMTDARGQPVAASLKPGMYEWID